MAAHPVEMIGVEHLLADHDRAHLEQARDEPAPCRQQEERHEPWSFRHLIIGHWSCTGWVEEETFTEREENRLIVGRDSIYYYSESLSWQVRAIVRFLFRSEQSDGMSEIVEGKPAGLPMSRWRWWLAIFLAAGLVWGGWVWWTDRNYRDAIMQIELEMANGRFATAARELDEAPGTLARLRRGRDPPGPVRTGKGAKRSGRESPGAGRAGIRVFAQGDPGSNASCTRQRATRRRRTDRQRRRRGSAK